jgi:hypothetical protein
LASLVFQQPGVVSQGLDIRLAFSLSVDNFVTAKAPNFNKS